MYVSHKPFFSVTFCYSETLMPNESIRDNDWSERTNTSKIRNRKLPIATKVKVSGGISSSQVKTSQSRSKGKLPKRARSDDPTKMSQTIVEYEKSICYKKKRQPKNSGRLFEQESSGNNSKSKRNIPTIKQKTIGKSETINRLRLPSEAPTALIAPDDYEHIYKDTKLPDEYSKRTQRRIPSDAPTALVIMVKEEEKAKERTTTKSNTEPMVQCCCCCII